MISEWSCLHFKQIKKIKCLRFPITMLTARGCTFVLVGLLQPVILYNLIFFNSFLRIESKHEVTILGGLNEFCVKFYGPSGSK